MNPSERFVRNAHRNGILVIKTHALKRMGERMIDLNDVITSIEKGIVIEYQPGYPGESPRLLFYSGPPEDFYAVVAVEPPQCILVSAIRVDWNIWKRVGNSIERR